MPADIPQSDVRVDVAGEQLTDWVEYSIESNILQSSDPFSFRVGNPRGRWSSAFTFGDEVKVFVDGSLQMTGYIDEITTSNDPTSGPTLELIGRDRFGQLVDCSATPATYRNKRFDDVCTALGSPFVTHWIYDNELNRIRSQQAKRRLSRLRRKSQFEKNRAAYTREAFRDLSTSPDTSEQRTALEAINQLDRKALEESQSTEKQIKKAQANLARIRAENFPRVKVEPGETPMDVIVRHSKKLGLMVWQSAQGEGVIARPEYDQRPSNYLWHYPGDSPSANKNNVISGSLRIDGRERCRTYRLLGYSANTANTSGTGSRHDLTLTDSDVSLEARQMIVNRASGESRQQAAAELEREMQRRKFDSLVAEYRVRGHHQLVDGNTNLWTIDTICSVDDPVLGISEQMYVVRRRFVGGMQGQHTEIELRSKGVLLP